MVWVSINPPNFRCLDFSYQLSSYHFAVFGKFRSFLSISCRARQIYRQVRFGISAWLCNSLDSIPIHLILAAWNDNFSCNLSQFHLKRTASRSNLLLQATWAKKSSQYVRSGHTVRSKWNRLSEVSTTFTDFFYGIRKWRAFFPCNYAWKKKLGIFFILAKIVHLKVVLTPFLSN